jgi:hypothetical protein
VTRITDLKCVCFLESDFKKSFSKLSCVCLTLEKLVDIKHFPVNEKYFSVKRKFDLIFRKVFSFYFERKTLFRSYEKIKNIILFADYVKFGPQTFDCYIFCLNLFSSSDSSLKFWFNLIFILTLVLIFKIVIYFFLIIFLIKILYLSNLVLILLIITYFI